MNERRETGIILRVRPLTETSLIVQWITAGMGRVSTVAKGARRAKSPFHGKLDMFFTAEMVILTNRRSNLHTLQEIRIGNTREPLRRSIFALRQAAYAIRLVEEASETDTPISDLYRLFESFLNAVTASPQNALLVLAFEVRLLDQSGLLPGLSAFSPEVRGFASILLHGEWMGLESLEPTRAEKRELRQVNAQFLVNHLGRLPEGRNMALDKISESS